MRSQPRQVLQWLNTFLKIDKTRLHMWELWIHFLLFNRSRDDEINPFFYPIRLTMVVLFFSFQLKISAKIQSSLIHMPQFILYYSTQFNSNCASMCVHWIKAEIPSQRGNVHKQTHTILPVCLALCLKHVKLLFLQVMW